MTRNLKISIVISILFLGLIRLRPIWERKPGDTFNVLFFLAILILFLWLTIKIIIEIVRLIRHRHNLTLKFCLPFAIMTISLLDGMFNPLKIDLDSLYGKVIFRACYEGTQNQATFKLRDNGKFDLHSTGVFFHDRFYVGKYQKYGDTIVLDYDGIKPRIFGDSLVISEEYIYELEGDTLINSLFYVGDCKGLN